MVSGDRGNVQITSQLCKGCYLCVAACPAKVLVQGDSFNRQGYCSVRYVGSGCTGCGICFYICPEPGAITVMLRKAENAGAAKKDATQSV
ncbi:MAG: 4Fe-4S ferredoxin, iron-sulfur binding domain protein [Acidobacteria bacterium]|nr:4Fe-4S ferredoxin, iron-sulfur binding domain protein [Acidobacteriota bacterium]